MKPEGEKSEAKSTVPDGEEEFFHGEEKGHSVKK